MSETDPEFDFEAAMEGGGEQPHLLSTLVFQASPDAPFLRFVSLSDLLALVRGMQEQDPGEDEDPLVYLDKVFTQMMDNPVDPARVHRAELL